MAPASVYVTDTRHTQGHPEFSPGKGSGGRKEAARTCIYATPRRVGGRGGNGLAIMLEDKGQRTTNKSSDAKLQFSGHEAR